MNIRGFALSLITSIALCLALPSPARAQNTACYADQGGSAQHIGSGCTQSVESGGAVTVKSGATETIASGGTLNAATGATVTLLGGTTLTTTSTEMNTLHSVTPGTTAASGALVVDSNKALDTLNIVAPRWGAGAGTAITSTAAEVNVLHSVTAGTVAASSAVVVDANSAAAGLKVPFGGAATTTAGTPLAGITDISNAASGTTQSTEYTLNSVSIPASAFSTNGRALRCEAWAQTAANANAKNIKFYFGTNAVVTVTGSTASGKDVHLELNVIRTAASTQTAQAVIQVDTGVAPSMAVAAPTETDTNAIVVAVKSANTAAAAASATGKGLSCYFIN